jgi:lipopolysaccharide transport system ATP-binding protein
MSDVVIRVENLSKEYRLGAIGRHTLREDVSRWWARGRGQPDPTLKIGQVEHGNQHGEQLWALQDVNLAVKQGEAVGIIGRNGAGKSTLLKILSRVTTPTRGEIKVKGRIASLLEVGTGFHPELTGSENIYLNGAILGMSKRKIAGKFDEIVDFSGVEKFIDTPVKRYSSGMYVRLAFAVAAHLDPEVLVIDEVLAVGDAEFQKRCLGKIGEVANAGRTVLFVSHNMGMITSLCSRAILLEEGKVTAQGSASDTVLAYFSRGRLSPYTAEFSQNGKKVGDEFATLLAAQIESQQGEPTAEVDIRAPFKVKMRYQLHKATPNAPFPNFHFFDTRGEYVFVSSGSQYANTTGAEAGIYVAECTVPGYLLNNGTYFIGLALTFVHQGIHVSFFERDALAVSIRDPIDETLDEMRNGYSGTVPGPVRPQLDWMIEKVL